MRGSAELHSRWSVSLIPFLDLGKGLRHTGFARAGNNGRAICPGTEEEGVGDAHLDLLENHKDKRLTTLKGLPSKFW